MLCKFILNVILCESKVYKLIDKGIENYIWRLYWFHYYKHRLHLTKLDDWTIFSHTLYWWLNEKLVINICKINWMYLHTEQPDKGRQRETFSEFSAREVCQHCRRSWKYYWESSESFSQRHFEHFVKRWKWNQINKCGSELALQKAW